MPEGAKDYIFPKSRSYVEAQYDLLDFIKWLPYRHILYCGGPAATQQRKDDLFNARTRSDMKALSTQTREDFEKAEEKRTEELDSEKDDRNKDKDARYRQIVSNHDQVMKDAENLLLIRMWTPDPSQRDRPVPGRVSMPTQPLTRTSATSIGHSPSPRTTISSVRHNTMYSSASTIIGDGDPPVPWQPTRTASPAPPFASSASTIAPDRPTRSHQYQRTSSRPGG